MSANGPVVGPVVQDPCEPFLCLLEQCIKGTLQPNTLKRGVCGKDEELIFKLGSNTTTKIRRKLGSCVPIEDREIELVIHITAKQCSDDGTCQTIYVQRNIEELFADNPCFCCLASGHFTLTDSDIIYEDKNTRKIIRQLVFTIPYRIRCGNPQEQVKCCNCEIEVEE